MGSDEASQRPDQPHAKLVLQAGAFRLYCPHETVLAKDRIAVTDEAIECGYEAWKRDKIVLGLKQAENRDAMIPIEQIWRDLASVSALPKNGFSGSG